MRLYLVRHAQSLRNAHIKSNNDSSLSEDGKEQARRLGIFFKKHNINYIYCSKLKRAKDTLNEILPYLSKIPVYYTKKINEHNLGIFAHNGHDDWAGYGDAVKKANIPFIEFTPEKGESLTKTFNRAKKFYQYLLKKYKDNNSNILIVGHGIFLLYLILNSMNLDILEGKYYKLSNASVSQLDINNQGQVRNYHINDYHHLIEGALKNKK